MPQSVIVVGLGYGDEGKGTITEYVSSRISAHTVVRYNGGSQAGHNIVTDDDKHHTFSQFGSATLQGVRTHLSRFMVFDLMAMREEAKSLKDNFFDPMELLTIEEEALLITPYQIAANRLREMERGWSRGYPRHGSCGRGVGETRSDYLAGGEEISPMVKDLRDPKLLLDKLEALRRRKTEEFERVESRLIYRGIPRFDGVNEALRLLYLDPSDVLFNWDIASKGLCIVGRDYLPTILTKHNVVFEGAQGILLDQDYGFQPHTTWTDTTTRNAEELLKEAGTKRKDTTTIGVSRTYSTRHGFGPFPTEIHGAAPPEWKDKRNPTNEWQHNFRTGHLDLVTMRYALEVQKTIRKVDYIAFTHSDVLDPDTSLMCEAYELGTYRPVLVEQVMKNSSTIRVNNPTSFGAQKDITSYLLTIRDKQFQRQDLVEFGSPKLSRYDEQRIEDIIETVIGIKSFGPRLKDKKLWNRNQVARLW